MHNVGAARQEGVAIGITLPDAVWSPPRPVATAVKQHKGWSVAAIYQSPGVYWLPLSLPAGETIKVRVKARVTACRTCGHYAGLHRRRVQVLCATAATGRRNTMRVKSPKRLAKTTLPSSACLAPMPGPGAPYVLVAENQQILGAEYTPFLGARRRALTREEDRSAEVATSRELSPQQYTVQDCYEACSAFGNYVVPWYMSFYEPPNGSAECYCSQKMLPMVYKPSSTVYRIDIQATTVGNERVYL